MLRRALAEATLSDEGRDVRSAHAERAGVDWLRRWVKRRPVAENGEYSIEERDGVMLASADSETRDADELSCA